MKLVQKIYQNREPPIIERSDIGSQYAIKASGGFQIANPSQTIHIKSIPNIAKYDMTDALIISFPANIINSLLIDDTVSITSEIFLQHLKPESFISFGDFENLYCKYESFINGNLCNHMFSNSIFSKLEKFDKHTFCNLFHSKTFVDSECVNAFTGDICICDVEKTLQNTHKLNIFGNRTMDTNIEFVAGDRLFMQDGISITMKTDLNIDPMYISMMSKCGESANRNIMHWDNISEKTYVANLLIYLV
jgi:hypothetical protein